MAAATLLVLAVGCATPPSSSVPAANPEAPVAGVPAAADGPLPQAPDALPAAPGGESGLHLPEEADTAAEEVTVVGQRIRRWLPVVGADWPDSNCHLSTRNLGHGNLRAIFIADLGRSGKAWRHVARLIARDGVRATLVTLPGSDGNRPCSWRGAVLARAAELVTSLVDGGDEPVSLIGDTFGARVALEVSTRFGPDAVDNLVLYDLVPYPWPFLNILLKAYRGVHPPGVFAAQARLAPPGYVSASAGLAFLEGDFTDTDARAELLGTYRRSDPVTVGYEFSRSIGRAADLRPLMAATDVPILAVWPQGPAGSERKNGDEVVAQYAELEGVTLHALEGHGASAMLEAPERIAEAMRSFWGKTGFGH